jgi:hypothetical protein
MSGPWQWRLFAMQCLSVPVMYIGAAPSYLSASQQVLHNHYYITYDYTVSPLGRARLLLLDERLCTMWQTNRLSIHPQQQL